jgi:phage anti-repressor protein
MSNFPAIQSHSYLTQAVSARELHQCMEINRDFSTWISGRIEQFIFVQGEDFIIDSFPQNGGKGGRPLVEYFITIDMAKELAMVERNDHGKRVRKYFIDCEKQLKQSQPENPLLQLANAVLTAQSIIADQSQKLLIAEPKAAALDLIAGSDDSRCIRDTAKELKIKPSRLTQYLMANSWIYRQSRDDAKLGKVMAYQHRIDQGLIEHCSVVIEQKGQTKLATSVKITGKGFAKLSIVFSGEI